MIALVLGVADQCLEQGGGVQHLVDDGDMLLGDLRGDGLLWRLAGLRKRYGRCAAGRILGAYLEPESWLGTGLLAWGRG